MSFKFAMLGLVAALITAGPAMAAHTVVTHTDPHVVATPTYCGESISELDAYGGYSRFVSSHGWIYQGGLHDTSDAGERGEVGVGFDISNGNITQFRFRAIGTQFSDFSIGYGFTDGVNFGTSDEGVEIVQGVRGVYKVTFNRANSGLLSNYTITDVLFEDFGIDDDFDDVADTFTVNGHAITSRNKLTEECVEFGCD